MQGLSATRSWWLSSSVRAARSVAGWLQLLGWLLLGISWLVPNHYRPWVSYHSELVAFVGVALLFTSCLLGTERLSFPRITIWLFICVLTVWGHWLAGLVYFFGDALISTLYLTALIAAIGVGYSCAACGRRPNGIGYLMSVIWMAALASAMVALLQWLSLESYLAGVAAQSDIGSRPMANVAQPNQLASLLLMGIAALTFDFERRAIGAIAYFVALAFLSFLLVLTESRTGILSALVLSGYGALKSRQRFTRVAQMAFAAWGGLVFLGGQLLPALNDALLIGGSRGLSLTDNNGRWHMWRQMAYALGEAPWFGYGWNQTVAAHAVGASAIPGELSISNAHSVVVDVLVWTGIPLGLLLSLAVAYWFVHRIWSLREAAGVYAMACLIPFAGHSLLEYPFAYSYFLLTAGLLVGVVEASMGTGSAFVARKSWLTIPFLLWSGVGSYHVYEYFLIEEDFRIVRFENMRIGKTPQDYVAPEIRMTSHLATMLTVARQPAVPGMPATQLEDLKQVARRFPFGALTFRYAVALGLNGDPEGATRQMQSVCGMYGKKYCLVTVNELRQMQTEKYPQLSAVRTPQ